MITGIPRKEEWTVLKGLLASGITMGVAAVFPEALVFSFFVGVLGLIVGVYPGMAMANTEGGHPVLEWMVALVILILGVSALWVSPFLLCGAWLLHAFWALMHPVTGLGDGAPGGFSRFCVSYDLVTACFVAYMWGVGA